MRRALFLHMQKTAGTSVQEMAREAYGNDQVISHGDFLTLKPEGCRKFDFVSGHFGYSFASALIDGRYSFTFLRDPVERLVSLYEFSRTRNPAENLTYAIAHAGDIEHFLREDHGPIHLPAIWNHQVWQLAYGWGMTMAGTEWRSPQQVDRQDLLELAKRNLARLDHVGFVATFESDVEKIFTDLGAPGLTARWANANPKRSSAPDLSAGALARLNAVTELDRALYDHAVQTYMIPARRKRWIKRVAGQVMYPFARRR